MAAARRIYSLIVDVSTGNVVDRSGRIWDPQDIRLIRGDACVFRFELINSVGDDSPYAIASGCSFKFGIKAASTITGATYLAFADNDAFNATGDWDQVSLANGKICVQFDTDTEAIGILLTGSGNTPVEVVAEVQITYPGEKPFTPAHFGCQVQNDVIRGDEGDPLPTTPTYPTSAELATRLGPGIQLVPKGNQVALLKDGVEIITFGAP